MSVWWFENKKFKKQLIEDNIGFVYLITNIATNKKYIGKKKFFKIVRKKGKKLLVDSDWASYYGSSVELQNDVKQYGKKLFERKILFLCKTKGELNYIELKEQVVNEVLLKDDYYNSYIGTRIHKNHVKNLKKC